MRTPAKSIPIDQYRYDLPESRIAKYPLDQRDTSKLLIYRQGNIHDSTFNEFPGELPEESVLVRNNTKVIQARLEFLKESGARIEIFCLEPAEPADYESNLAQAGQASWVCLIGNARKWKEGALKREIGIGSETIVITAVKTGTKAGKAIISFSWQPENYSLSDILDYFGQTPIPPYLQRDSEPVDKIRYQTIYAVTDGSVAAPTAGLHFTLATEEYLKARRIKTAEITLHVGAGTFTPVKSQLIGGHKMHTEHITVHRSDLHHMLNNDQAGITAIGTTSLRALESIYWYGYLLKMNRVTFEAPVHIDQWLPYDISDAPGRREALLEIVLQMAKRQQETVHFSTSLIIVPGYSFRMVDRLLTNFHQPGSTLLLLVAAFIGDDWAKVYNHALESDYRFLSYGDSSLLFRQIDE